MISNVKPMLAPTFDTTSTAPKPPAAHLAPSSSLRAGAGRSDDVREPDNRRRQPLVRTGYSISITFNAGDDVEVQVLMRDGEWKSVARSQVNPGLTTANFLKSAVDLTKGVPQIRLVNHKTNTTLVDYDPTAVQKKLVGGATVMNWEDRPGWPGQNDFSNVSVTITPMWGPPTPLAPAPTPKPPPVPKPPPKPAPAPLPKPARGRKLTQAVEHDLRVIERWSTQKPSVRQEALRDVFGFLKDEVFAKSSARIKDAISQLESVFGELQSVLPRGAFDRLGAVLRSLCVNGETFFLTEEKFMMHAFYVNDSRDLPSLGIHWRTFEGKPQMLKAALMHEMVHFAFDSPVTRSAVTKLLDNPVFHFLAVDAAPNPAGRGQLSFDFAKIGMIEAMANDPVFRTGSRSGYLDIVGGAGLVDFISEFGKAFRRNIPKGAGRSAFGNLSSAFWGGGRNDDRRRVEV